MADQQYDMAFDGGSVRMWIEQGSSIMLKAAVPKHNDPVELTSHEAREIAHALLRLADALDQLG